MNFNPESHKKKIEFSEFPSMNFFKFCTYQDIPFFILNTDFHKIKSNDFFTINFEPFCTSLENVSICFFLKYGRRTIKTLLIDLQVLKKITEGNPQNGKKHRKNVLH